jgi:hypothetical protein
LPFANLYLTAISRLQKWRGRRQMRHAARLLKRGAIERIDYGLLILDGVARLEGQSLDRHEPFHPVTFGLEVCRALGVPPVSEIAAYGPFHHAADWVQKEIGARHWVSMDSPRAFAWSPEAEALLKTAKLRLRLANRVAFQVERWYAEQSELFPNLHGPVWKWLGWILSAGAGFVIGRLTSHR